MPRSRVAHSEHSRVVAKNAIKARIRLERHAKQLAKAAVLNAEMATKMEHKAMKAAAKANHAMEVAQRRATSAMKHAEDMLLRARRIASDNQQLFSMAPMKPPVKTLMKLRGSKK